MSAAPPPWVVEMLATARVGRLATADAAGRPMVVPVCYVWDGAACYSAIDRKPKRVEGRRLRRVRNIEANPHAALVVDQYDEDWSELAWVMVEGPAELLVAPRQRRRAADDLRDKYPQYAEIGLDEDALIIKLAAVKISHWRFDRSQRFA